MTQTEKGSSLKAINQPILVCVAWPYANGPFHVGHIAGVYLPADIFARFQRAQGSQVLMVSGSDCHGAPITIRAEHEGRTPLEVIEEYHASFLQSFNFLGITFDLFTKTFTENHYAVTRDMFLRLLDKGDIYRDKMIGSYSESLKRFLPDRYVEGECYNCHYGQARGDQCDKCGILIDTEKLIKPYSVIDKQPIIFKETEHFFLNLAKLEPALLNWLDDTDHSYWRSNTINFTRNWLKEGLHGRAITRDLDWGVPVPVNDPEFKDKRIYVWFDAVIGYLSASKEWAQRHGEPDAWKTWWSLGTDSQSPARSYYFLGKDNIPFHTIIWPAMLIGYGELNLPYDVVANEFLNLESEQMSTGRNWAVWMPDIQSRYQADQLRYYLTAIAPETHDSNWSWAEFVSRANNELVATYGNLVNRVLNLTSRYFENKVPQPGMLDELDRELLAERERVFAKVTELLSGAHIRDALREVMALATAGNVYLEKKRPWETGRTDLQLAATTLYIALQLLNALKVLAYPFLPFSSEQLHSYLGFAEGDLETGTYSGRVEAGLIKIPATARWELATVPVGQLLRPAKILFNKIDPDMVDYELTKLKEAASIKRLDA
jgi:methionyl-tRNA synthetase